MIKAIAIVAALLLPVPAEAGCFLFWCWPPPVHHRHVHHRHHARRVVVIKKTVVKKVTVIKKIVPPVASFEPIRPIP